MGDFELTLFNNLQIDNLSHENFYEFYNSIVESIIKYNGSVLGGSQVELTADRTKEINDEINMLNKEIKKLRLELKKKPNQD